MLVERELTGRIVDAAIHVHRTLGPGLLESAYRGCLQHRLQRGDLQVQCEVPVPIFYEGLEIQTGYRADLIVENRVLVELKAAERILPLHEAQILTYLKVSGLHVGLLINFNVPRLQLGLRRFVR